MYNWTLRHKDVWASGITAVCILKLVVRCRQAVTFAFRPLLSLHPSNTKLGGPQGRSERCREQKVSAPEGNRSLRLQICSLVGYCRLHATDRHRCMGAAGSNFAVQLVMAVMFMHEASVSERTGLSLVHPTPGCRKKGCGSWPASDIHLKKKTWTRVQGHLSSRKFSAFKAGVTLVSAGLMLDKATRQKPVSQPGL